MESTEFGFTDFANTFVGYMHPTNFSKLTKLKLGIIKHWPLANKMRMAKFLIPATTKSGVSFFKGLSILNKETILETDTKNYLEYSVFSTGSYEPEICSMIKSQLYEGQVAIDIGANVGIHTITMAKQVGAHGQVVAFEPVSFLREKLKSNLKLNNIQNVQIIPKALSDRNDKVKVQFNPQAANLGTTSLGNTDVNGNEELDVAIGDEVLQSMQLKTIDLIKIDVEGFELNVLKGLKTSIDKYKPRIIFEYDSNYIQRISEGNENVSETIFNFFSEIQYSIYFIQEQGTSPIHSYHELPKSGNLFAIFR